MKKVILLFALTLLIVGCGEDEKSHGVGRIAVETFDTPPPANVEHIYLTMTEVSVHKSGGDWITLAEPDTVYDFLELINGVTEVIVDDTLEPGHYTQLRLVVADSNGIVIDGENHPLRVPSGAQTGVKLNLDFTLEEDELIEVYLDFDASKSITWTPGNYLLRPTFKAFKKVISGTVAGTVKDSLGSGIGNALVEAKGSSDTVSTFTDDTGTYKLILIEGTYDIEASAEGYALVDTVYSGLQVPAETDLTGYDFMLTK